MNDRIGFYAYIGFLIGTIICPAVASIAAWAISPPEPIGLSVQWLIAVATILLGAAVGALVGRVTG
jgi:hypothetical protein